MLDYFIGIIPFFFVSTIYNIDENLSRGFVRKMQKYFLGPCDRKLAMTGLDEGNSSGISETYECPLDMNNPLRNLHKNRHENREKVGIEDTDLILTKRAGVTMINASNQTLYKCDDEDSRTQANSKASRGGCEPGDSSGDLKITSEQQPKLIVGAAGTLPLFGDAYAGMQ